MRCSADSRSKSYYANREKFLREQAEYHRRPDIKERMRLYRRVVYANNSAAIKAKSADWYYANHDAARAQRKLYRDSTKEAIRRRDKEYQKSNRPICAAAARRYRARKRGANGSHTAAEIVALLKAQRYRCAGCSTSIKIGHHADHILPLKLGGSNSISNIQMLCKSCNCSKGAKDPIDWAKRLGRLL